jgi:hypothetical protein
LSDKEPKNRFREPGKEAGQVSVSTILSSAQGLGYSIHRYVDIYVDKAVDDCDKRCHDCFFSLLPKKEAAGIAICRPGGTA